MAKISSKEKVLNKICIVNGSRMTVGERNLMMKLDYINGGGTIADVAHKYGMNVDSVYNLSRTQKWQQQKKDMEKQIEQSAKEQYMEVYAKCGVDINLMYNNTWQKIINLCNKALNEPDKYLTSSEGKIRYGALQVLAEVVDKAQKGQQFTTGFIGREASAKLELQREMVMLRKKLAGEDDDEDIVQDNFMEALEGINKELWQEEGMTNEE